MRHILLGAIALLSLVSSVPAAQRGRKPQEPVEELRGVWLTNVDSKVLTSRRKIAKAMETLKRTNINVVFPVVWNKGYTLYPSETAERVLGVKCDPTYKKRDVLQELIEEAHALDIAVVPWFEYGFAASYKGKGNDPLKKKPEWSSIGRDGKLVEKNGFRWMNSFDPEVQEFVSALVLEVAAKYDIEGVQGDDRLPALPTEAGYDDRTVARWREETGKAAPENPKDPEWVRWRAGLLTDYLAGLRAQLRELKPDLIFSSSPTPPGWGLNEYLQDSGSWLKNGLVDWIHPQAYRRDAKSYAATMGQILEQHYGKPASPRLFPGILIKSGSYVIEAEELIRCIEWNRENDIQGEVLFFYEGLIENKDLIKALVKGPYARPANLPTLPTLAPAKKK